MIIDLEILNNLKNDQISFWLKHYFIVLYRMIINVWTKWAIDLKR